MIKMIKKNTIKIFLMVEDGMTVTKIDSKFEGRAKNNRSNNVWKIINKLKTINLLYTEKVGREQIIHLTDKGKELQKMLIPMKDLHLDLDLNEETNAGKYISSL
jgi:predicted transcriptional regulator